MLLLGYPEISCGRNFQLRILRKDTEAFSKQIDVLAKDDETVVVTECKSSSNITRRSLQKDTTPSLGATKPGKNREG